MVLLPTSSNHQSQRSQAKIDVLFGKESITYTKEALKCLLCYAIGFKIFMHL